MTKAKTKSSSRPRPFPKRQPPFYWSLILAAVILLEIGLLLNEKIWSHGYLSVQFERTWGQVEKLKRENERLYSGLSHWYNQEQQFISLGFVSPAVEFVPPTQLSLRAAPVDTRTGKSQADSGLGFIR